MPGDDPAGDEDPCPLCGGPGPGQGPPARVSLAQRRPPHSESAAVTAAGAPGGDEAAALREALARQRREGAELQAELEAERGAAAGAASEAMSMILRLQREKSEAMMEARQYRRYAEERFAHDAAEVAALHDAVERRDAAVRALSAQLRACRAQLLHLGFPAPGSSLPSSPTSAGGGLHDHPFADAEDDDEEYPSIQCVDHPASADVGTPRTHHLLNRMPGQEEADKAVVCSSPPRRARHVRTLSGDGLAYGGKTAMADEFHLFPDRDAPDRDDEGDRVYTVDAVHGVPVMSPEDCCYFGAPRPVAFSEEEEIQKLKARLHALEADRESMRHAIMSIGDEKAQVVLLREIAQQLCKDAAPFPAVSLKVQAKPQPVVVAQKKVVKRQPSFVKFIVVTMIKWIASIFSWRRKSDRIRYPIGLCGSNVGLMLVLDRIPKQRYRRFLKRS